MKKENSKTVEKSTDNKEKENQLNTESKDKEKITEHPKKYQNNQKKGRPKQEDETKEEGSPTEKDNTEDKDLSKEIQNQKDRYLRLFAEFENFKKRTAKERLELLKTASQDIMQSILPVLDDFDRALKEIKKSNNDDLAQGVDLIYSKLKETLKNKGLEPIYVKSGDVFDADIHEAVTQIPAPDKSLKGKIVDVVEAGYTLGEKIIRYPKVVTGK